MANSSSHENKVVSYLKPGDKKFIDGYSEVYRMTESKAVATAVQILRNTTPKKVVEQIMSKK